MAYNIADLFEHAVDYFPERLAVACGDEELTYAQLEEQANRLAHHLAEHGVQAGDHVGMCTRNRAQAIVTMLAVYKLRAALINVNFRYTANEIRYVLENADVVALVHEQMFADRVAEALPGAPSVQHAVVIEDESELPFSGTAYKEALVGSRPERDFEPRSNDDLYLLYTGGTTGQPKGVIWRHEDVWRTLGGGINFVTGEPLDSEYAQAESGKVTGGLTRICLAPLIHGNAQWAALMALFAGDTVVLLTQFDPVEVWRAVERRKANLIVLIGDAMARPMIEVLKAGRVGGARGVAPAGYDVSTLFAISSSAALFSPSVKKEYLEALPNVVITDAIGSSETGFMGIGMITKDSEQGVGGPRVSAGRDTIVIDDDDKPLPPGSPQIGRLARGGHIPLGYYKDPDKTARLFVEVDGRRYTVPGDFARHEADGTITLLGRGNTCVNTGGEKVFPEEVESALMSHPDVFDVLVIGVPDDRLGERVAAVVEPRAGAAPTFDELAKHVRAELAGYKVPRSIWLVDRVRRLATGKADYRWANEYAAAHRGAELASG